MGRFLLAIICLLFFTCETRNFVREPQLSDTVMVLNQAITLGVDSRYMPDADELKGGSHFGDTILLTSQALPIELLPDQVYHENFKIMSQKDVCAALKIYENLEVHPKYLNISKFERSDTGYYVQLQSIGCSQFASGGSLGIYLKKLTDGFVVVKKQASSIN